MGLVTVGSGLEFTGLPSPEFFRTFKDEFDACVET